MGLTITSVWRVLVYDTENTLDQVRYMRTVPPSLLSSERHAHSLDLGTPLTQPLCRLPDGPATAARMSGPQIAQNPPGTAAGV